MDPFSKSNTLSSSRSSIMQTEGSTRHWVSEKVPTNKHAISEMSEQVTKEESQFWLLIIFGFKNVTVY